jgi:hypothetical protein
MNWISGMAQRSAAGRFARVGRKDYVGGMPRWITALLALLALALGSSHAAAMAQMPAPPMQPVQPVQPVAAAPSAELPCHGDTMEQAPAGKVLADRMPAENAPTKKAPDCCPDGCAGGCLMLAAFWPMPELPPAVAPASLLQAFQPSLPPEADPDGLKRPPRLLV